MAAWARGAAPAPQRRGLRHRAGHVLARARRSRQPPARRRARRAALAAGSPISAPAGAGWRRRRSTQRPAITELDLYEAEALALDAARANVADPRAALPLDRRRPRLGAGGAALRRGDRQPAVPPGPRRRARPRRRLHRRRGAHPEAVGAAADWSPTASSPTRPTLAAALPAAGSSSPRTAPTRSSRPSGRGAAEAERLDNADDLSEKAEKGGVGDGSTEGQALPGDGGGPGHRARDGARHGRRGRRGHRDRHRLGQARGTGRDRDGRSRRARSGGDPGAERAGRDGGRAVQLRGVSSSTARSSTRTTRSSPSRSTSTSWRCTG